MDKSTTYELVKSAIGLDYFKVGTCGIDRAVNLRRIRTNNETVDEYIAYLEKSGGDELALLIEEIIVPETWFFRDRTPFDYLSHYVTSDWLNKRGERSLNVLSFPCSTGEEPYSIAMVLAKIGLPADLINIDACDISSRCIETARRGIYRANSFRGDEGEAYRDLFSHQGGLYYLNDEIRTMVDFRQANILNAESVLGLDKYDIIFCRNLLIYLEQDMQFHVCESLVSRLTVGGAFFVGHAEVNSVARLSQLEQVRQPGAFAFIKSAEKATLPGDQPSDMFSSAGGRPVNSDSMVANRLLQQAEQLIDTGDLAAARYLCESAVEMEPFLNKGFYLLATIASKKEDWLTAQTLFHKVLYLDPAHIEALQQLLECARHLGDEELCLTLNARLSRMRAREES